MRKDVQSTAKSPYARRELARYHESVSKKAQPDESLNQLLKVLPLLVETRKDTWKLKEGIQFLDIADGIDEFYKERKSYNDAEVEAVDALVLSCFKQAFLQSQSMFSPHTELNGAGSKPKPECLAGST